MRFANDYDISKRMRFDGKQQRKKVPGTESPNIGVDFCFFAARLIRPVGPIFANRDRLPKYQVAFPTLGRSADSCPAELLASPLVPFRVRLLPRMETASAAPLTLEVFAHKQ